MRSRETFPRTPPEADHVLPVETCRRLLGAPGRGLSDDQVRRRRDEMYDLARVVMAAFEQERRIGLRGPTVEATALALVPADDREAIEERAAVLEFDANMSRDAATRTALDGYLMPAKHRRKNSK